MAYYKRRIIKRSILRGLKGYEQEFLAKICAVIILIILVIFAFSYLTQKNWKINIKDVAAMRVPYSAVLTLNSMSNVYGIPLPELLAVFAVDNRFYAIQMAAKSETDIMQRYIMDYNDLKKSYGKKIEPYSELLTVLMTEIKHFPVLDSNGGYMYGDSFGAAWLSGQKNHNGADIIDRENRAGRLVVVNMAAGVVEDCGISADDGNYIGIRTTSGNYYYYAHLDSISALVVKGSQIAAGEVLGYMGSTGKNETKYGYPVRLHLGIRVKTKLSNDDMWINPYIFLRIIESGTINAVSQ